MSLTSTSIPRATLPPGSAPARHACAHLATSPRADGAHRRSPPSTRKAFQESLVTAGQGRHDTLPLSAPARDGQGGRFISRTGWRPGDVDTPVATRRAGVSASDVSPRGHRERIADCLLATHQRCDDGLTTEQQRTLAKHIDRVAAELAAQGLTQQDVESLLATVVGELRSHGWVKAIARGMVHDAPPFTVGSLLYGLVQHLILSATCPPAAVMVCMELVDALLILGADTVIGTGLEALFPYLRRPEASLAPVTGLDATPARNGQRRRSTVSHGAALASIYSLRNMMRWLIENNVTSVADAMQNGPLSEWLHTLLEFPLGPVVGPLSRFAMDRWSVSTDQLTAQLITSADLAQTLLAARAPQTRWGWIETLDIIKGRLDSRIFGGMTAALTTGLVGTHLLHDWLVRQGDDKLGRPHRSLAIVGALTPVYGALGAVIGYLSTAVFATADPRDAGTAGKRKLSDEGGRISPGDDIEMIAASADIKDHAGDEADSGRGSLEHVGIACADGMFDVDIGCVDDVFDAHAAHAAHADEAFSVDMGRVSVAHGNDRGCANRAFEMV